MKFTVDVDCTPEEARTFLGLPDVKPMQDVLLKQIEERLSASMAAMDPGVQGFEQLQKFWTQVASAAARKDK